MPVSLYIHLFVVFGDVPPYACCRGQLRQSSAEGLDSAPLIVAALFEDRKGFGPGHVTLGGRTPVVF